VNCSVSRKGAEWCATYPGCLFGAGVRRISIQVHGEDLFKHGHVCAVGARGRPHWPRYGRNGRSYLRCLIRPDGKEPVHGDRGERGRRLRSRIPQRRCRGTTTSIRVFDGGKYVRVFIPKGAVRAALSVYGMGSGNLGARGGAVGDNSGAHFGLTGTIDFTASGRGTCAGGTRRGGRR